MFYGTILEADLVKAQVQIPYDQVLSIKAAAEQKASERKQSIWEPIIAQLKRQYPDKSDDELNSLAEKAFASVVEQYQQEQLQDASLSLLEKRGVFSDGPFSKELRQEVLDDYQNAVAQKKEIAFEQKLTTMILIQVPLIMAGGWVAGLARAGTATLLARGTVAVVGSEEAAAGVMATRAYAATQAVVGTTVAGTTFHTTEALLSSPIQGSAAFDHYTRGCALSTGMFAALDLYKVGYGAVANPWFQQRYATGQAQLQNGVARLTLTPSAEAMRSAGEIGGESLVLSGYGYFEEAVHGGPGTLEDHSFGDRYADAVMTVLALRGGQKLAEFSLGKLKSNLKPGDNLNNADVVLRLADANIFLLSPKDFRDLAIRMGFPEMADVPALTDTQTGFVFINRGRIPAENPRANVDFLIEHEEVHRRLQAADFNAVLSQPKWTDVKQKYLDEIYTPNGSTKRLSDIEILEELVAHYRAWSRSDATLSPQEAALKAEFGALLEATGLANHPIFGDLQDVPVIQKDRDTRLAAAWADSLGILIAKYPSNRMILTELASEDSLGIAALMQVEAKDSKTFVEAINIIQKQKLTFNKLAGEIGIESLRQAFVNSTYKFQAGMDFLANNPRTFNIMNDLKSLTGLNSIVEIYLQDPLWAPKYFLEIKDIKTFADTFNSISKIFGQDFARKLFVMRISNLPRSFESMKSNPDFYLVLDSLISIFGIDTIKEGFFNEASRDSNDFILVVNLFSKNPNLLDTLIATDGLGVECLAKIMREDTTAFLKTFEQISEPQNETNFFTAVKDISATSYGLAGLRDSFVRFPGSTVLALVEYGRHRNTLKPYLQQDGSINLNQLMADRNMHLRFPLGENASINATRGTIAALGIDPHFVEISCFAEITPELARRSFPGYNMVPNESPLARKTIKVDHFDHNDTELKPQVVELPYDPYKYVLPPRASTSERQSLRENMGLGERSLIIVSSLMNYDTEKAGVIIEQYKKAYSNTPPNDRPVLVIAQRQPIYKPGDRVSFDPENLRVGNRNPNDQTSSEPWTADGKKLGDLDVVFLNTTGEVITLMKAADLAVLNSNRNIFEPASQGVPTLYFTGEWGKNRTAKNLLDETGGAIPIDPDRLGQQFVDVLSSPNSLQSGALTATSSFDTHVTPASKMFGSLTIAGALLDAEP